MTLPKAERATKTLRAGVSVVDEWEVVESNVPDGALARFAEYDEHEVARDCHAALLHRGRRRGGEVRDVGQQIQNAADGEAERAGDLEGSHWVLDFVQHVGGVGPAASLSVSCGPRISERSYPVYELSTLNSAVAYA